MKPEHERLNKYIDDLQAGRHPGTGPAQDDEEFELFQAAATWNAVRQHADDPDAAFIRNLRAELADTLANKDAEGQAQTPPNLRAIGERNDKAGAGAPQRISPVAVSHKGIRLGRRQFLGGAAAAAAGLAAGLGLDRVFRGSEVQAFAEPEGKLNPQQGKWFAVARAPEVLIGQVLHFTAGNVKGFLLHRDDGFVALSGICTHLGCDLSWQEQMHALGCGCHGSSFDTAGKPLTGPAIYKEPIRPLPNFQLKIENDIVYVMA